MAIITKPPFRTDVMNLSEGEISISYPATITPDDFEDINEWLALFQKKMKRFVSESPPSDPPPDDASGISVK